MMTPMLVAAGEGIDGTKVLLGIVFFVVWVIGSISSAAKKKSQERTGGEDERAAAWRRQQEELAAQLREQYPQVQGATGTVKGQPAQRVVKLPVASPVAGARKPPPLPVAKKLKRRGVKAPALPTAPAVTKAVPHVVGAAVSAQSGSTSVTRRDVGPSLIPGLDRASLRSQIVVMEVLGKPVALRE